MQPHPSSPAQVCALGTDYTSMHSPSWHSCLFFKDQAGEAGGTAKAASCWRPGAIVQHKAPEALTAALTEQAPRPCHRAEHASPQASRTAIVIVICIDTLVYTKTEVHRHTYSDTTAHACTPAHTCMHAAARGSHTQPEAARPGLQGIPSSRPPGPVHTCMHPLRITHPVTRPRPPTAHTTQRQRPFGRLQVPQAMHPCRG